MREPAGQLAPGDGARRGGELLHRHGDARRDDAGHRHAEHDAHRRERGSAPANPPHQRVQLLPRAGDEQHTQRRAVWSDQGNAVDRFGIVGPLHRIHRLTAALPHARDERGQRRRVRNLAVRINQLLLCQRGLDIAVEEHAHPRRKDQRLEKVLIQTPPADDRKRPAACTDGADREQPEIEAARQLDGMKKRRPLRRRCVLRDPGMPIAEARRPLGRRDQCAVGGDQVKKLEAVRAGQQ